MKNSISYYLKKIRRKTIINDMKLFFFRGYSFLLALFLICIFLENLFYFSTNVRIKFLHGFSNIILLILIFAIISLIMIAKNKINPYKWNTIANKISKSYFNDHDELYNAFQIENQSNDFQSKTLKENLSDSVLSILNKINLLKYFSSKKINKWRQITFYLLIATLLTIVFTWEKSSQSIYRWSHPNIEFQPPIPFTIKSNMRHVNVLAGENVELIFSTKGDSPDSLLIELKSLDLDSDQDSSIISSAYLKDNKYSFVLNNVLQNYQYRAYYNSKKIFNPWDEISSKEYSISIIDRPSIEDFTATIYPPKYTNLNPIEQKANQSEINALLGSTINISIRSNLNLAKAEIAFSNKIKKMNINDKTANYSFEIFIDDQFTINLTDERGVKNRNPIPFQIIKNADQLPSIYVTKPLPFTEISGNQLIPIDVTIKDDFGFSNLQLAYEIKRPAYIKSEPIISMFSIPLIENKKNKQDINTIWDLNPLGLMPEDEINFHFELYDNDLISGPKKIISKKFNLRLPSLNDLFRSFSNKEDNISNTVEVEIENIKNIKKQIKKIELDLLKSENVEWEEVQALKKILDETKKKMSDFDSISKELKNLSKQGQTHQLFSSELLQKFNELNELIDKIIPMELFDEINSLNEKMNEMNPKEILEAIKNLSNNLGQVESELDRFLDIFKKVRAEQVVEEIRKKTNQIIKNQNNLDQKIRSTTPNTDSKIFKKLATEEKLNKKELDDIINSLDQASKTIKIFSRPTAQYLENLSDSKTTQLAQNSLEQAIKSLNNKSPYKAMDASSSSIKSLLNFKTNLDNALDSFQKQSVQDMSTKFRNLLTDILNISKEQEALRDYSKEIPRNSSKLNKLAGDQQLLQDQLKKIMKKSIDLSKETFLITPKMGKALGQAFSQMNSSKGKLAERNSTGSITNQDKVIISLNNSAKNIIKTINEMHESRKTTGYEEFLKRMSDMSNQQNSINEQGMNLALGQYAANMQQSIMKDMLSKQMRNKKSLNELIQELNNTSNINSESLNGIIDEMNKVINNLKNNKFDQITYDRQQKILSRMLDSQKSITKRGEEEKERQSVTAIQKNYINNTNSDEGFGQNNTIILDAMNEALSSGFSAEYQKMIRRYFNSMLKEGAEIKNNSMEKKTTNEPIK